jgi:hypothetical protein
MKARRVISGKSIVIACATLLAAHSNAVARESEKHAAEATAETPRNADSGSPNEVRGISLGGFRIRSYYPVDAQKSTLRFTLFAAVKGEHFTETQRLTEEHRQLLRDQILTATRLAPLAIFQEPDLKTFRRRVLVRIRRALPDLDVDDLYVCDFDMLIKSL